MKLRLTVYKITILFFLVAMAVSGIGLTACTPAKSSVSNLKTEASPPGIEIIIPGKNNAGGPEIAGDYWFPVLVEVSNFKLVDKLGEPNVAGEGHIHYFLDVMPAIITEETDSSTYAETSDNFYYWYDIGEGTHTFSAELVNNDDTPLSPRVLDMVTVSSDTSWDG